VADKAPYSVAIIDVQMPEMDGPKDQCHPLLSETRLIMLTPFGKPISIDELQIVRVGACCIKPVRQSALLDFFSKCSLVARRVPRGERR
jgi:DNA-binding response OmpR family regulator